VASALATDVPLHFTAFHPDWKLDDLPPTPPATLTRAREIALREGLQYVYTGNVHDAEGGTTFCPGCGEALIVRDWHRILKYHVTGDGRCLSCACRVDGRFALFDKQFGRRRIPVRLSALR
jgi:pyruvate formate lyase activating enzyme